MVQAAAGSGSYVWNTRGVAPGTYYLAGYMYDWNGTAMIYHLTQSITIAAQSFTLTGPTSGTYTVGQEVTIAWTAANVRAGSSLSLCYDEDTTWLNGNEHWIVIDALPVSAGSGSWKWNTRGVAPGTYYIAGYMYDGNGRATVSHLTQAITLAAGTPPPVTVDPQQSFTLAGPTSGTYSAGALVPITWTVAHVTARSTISLCYDADRTWMNGNEHWIEVDRASASNGTGTWLWNTRGVAPGTYYIAGYMYDGQGTYRISQLTQAVTIASPSFALSGPTSGTYAVGDNVTVRWTAGNVRAGSTISLCCDEDTTWLNGNEHWIEIDMVQAASGSGSYVWNTRGVAPGTYYLAGYMYDWNGTAVVSQLSQPITIVAQSFALSGPTSGSYTVGQAVTITWTSANLPAGATVSLCYDEDTTWWNGNEHWIEVDSALASARTWLWNTRGVAPGTYYLAGYAYDRNGAWVLSHLADPITLAP
jgi:nuclear transport factor 2 (NTF2) superfamily protein